MKKVKVRKKKVIIILKSLAKQQYTAVYFYLKYNKLGLKDRFKIYFPFRMEIVTFNRFLTGNKKSFVNLKDRLGVDFKVYTACDDALCFNTIYNSKPTSLHKYFSRIKERKVNTYIFSFTDENLNELEDVTNFYKHILRGENIEPSFEFTAYHAKNSIL